MHGVDFLFQYATSAMEDELLAESFIPEQSVLPKTAALVCDCCGRSAADWYRPEAVRSIIYRQSVVHCLACYSLFHGSKKYLGIERTALSSEGQRAVPGKLGMLSTCAMLVTTEGSTIFTGENYEKKLLEAEAPFFSLVRATGWGQILALLEMNPEPPFLFISNLGRRKEALVANLRVTTQSEQWQLCSADEIDVLNPGTVASVVAAIDEHAIPIDAAEKWLSSLWRVATGGMRADDRIIVELSNQVPNFRRNILPLLPNDPYQRIGCVRAVQKWLEVRVDRL